MDVEIFELLDSLRKGMDKSKEIIDTVWSNLWDNDPNFRNLSLDEQSEKVLKIARAERKWLAGGGGYGIGPGG